MLSSLGEINTTSDLQNVHDDPENQDVQIVPDSPHANYRNKTIR